MDRIRSMIVGVDFTPCSRHAVIQAMRIAKWNRARLLAVHALDPLIADELESLMSTFGGSSSDGGACPGIVDELNEEWRDFSSRIAGAQAVPFSVDIDAPLASMQKRVDLHHADLLVLGTHGRSSTAGAGGRLASACVRSTKSKVLLVRDDQPDAFRNVVACIDFSDASREALAQGVRVALQDEAFLHVVHVFEMPWKKLGRAAPKPPEAEKNYRRSLPTRLREFVEPFKHELGYLAPEYALIEDSRQGEAIARYVSDLTSPLVVLGTRGRTDMPDLLVGSTAERVVSDAPCSILAIRPH